MFNMFLCLYLIVNAMNKEQQKYRSVLAIDDHNMVVNGIKLLIGDHFRDFYHANSGVAGMELALKHQPQLVIVDNILPDISGDAVVKEIRTHCPQARILGYSFSMNGASIRKMYEAGINGYVDKSEDDAELNRAVTDLLEGKEYFSKEARSEINPGRS